VRREHVVCDWRNAAAAGLSAVDAAIAGAIACISRGDGRGCDAEAATIERALLEVPPGNAGWLLPVAPIHPRSCSGLHPSALQ
jgi:hypothetical protein